MYELGHRVCEWFFSLRCSCLLSQIASRITQVDFDGVADGRAIRNCLGNVKPRKLILVHGTEKTTNELKTFVESSIPMCEAVFTPNVMECIDIESDTNVYKLSLKESLYTSAVFRKVRDACCRFVKVVICSLTERAFAMCRLAATKWRTSRACLLYPRIALCRSCSL